MCCNFNLARIARQTPKHQTSTASPFTHKRIALPHLFRHLARSLLPASPDQLDKLIPGGGGGGRDQINTNWPYHPDALAEASLLAAGGGGGHVDGTGGEDRSDGDTASRGDSVAAATVGDAIGPSEMHHHQKFERIDSANKVRIPAEKGLTHTKFTSTY